MSKKTFPTKDRFHRKTKTWQSRIYWTRIRCWMLSRKPSQKLYWKLLNCRRWTQQRSSSSTFLDYLLGFSSNIFPSDKQTQREKTELVSAFFREKTWRPVVSTDRASPFPNRPLEFSPSVILTNPSSPSPLLPLLLYQPDSSLSVFPSPRVQQWTEPVLHVLLQLSL